MGRVISAALSHKVAGLGLVGRQLSQLRRIKSGLGRSCKSMVFSIAQKANEKEISAIVRRCFSALPKCSALIYCIGDNYPSPVHTTSSFLWEKILFANLTLAFYFVRAFVDESRKSNYSNEPAIIALCSSAGLDGFPNAAAYCSAKHGLIGLMRSVHSDYGQKVRVIAICPGLIRTKSLLRNIRRQAKMSGERPRKIHARISGNRGTNSMLSRSEVSKRILDLLMSSPTSKSRLVVSF